MSKHYEIEWFDVATPPSGCTPVLVMASNPLYQFGHPQMLTGTYIDKYYDTPINEFRLTATEERDRWHVIKWAYAPSTCNVDISPDKWVTNINTNLRV